MFRYLLVLFLIISINFSLATAQEKKAIKAERIKQKYIITKNKISNSEQFTRRVSATLSKINKKMRRIRRKKNKLNSKTQGITIQNINSRKSQIARQLRALYKMSNLNQMMYILNSKSIHEFEQNTKYLKMYSESDYELVLEYADNIKTLNDAKIKLSDSIKDLKIATEALNSQNKDLNTHVHPGTVNYVGSVRGLGEVVIIEHGDNYYTVYGNNHDTFVRAD